MSTSPEGSTGILPECSISAWPSLNTVTSRTGILASALSGAASSANAAVAISSVAMEINGRGIIVGSPLHSRWVRIDPPYLSPLVLNNQMQLLHDLFRFPVGPTGL